MSKGKEFEKELRKAAKEKGFDGLMDVLESKMLQLKYFGIASRCYVRIAMKVAYDTGLDNGADGILSIGSNDGDNHP